MAVNADWSRGNYRTSRRNIHQTFFASVTNMHYSAQWLRDTGNQFAHLYKLLPLDKDLQALVKTIINTEARYISKYPYCGE